MIRNTTRALLKAQDATTAAERPTRVESAAVRQVLTQIRQVAPTPSAVLLLGETGTGKEVMARAIHDLSPRRQRRIITVNCAAIPTTFIESELLGREKGAYTDALSRQIGRFESCPPLHALSRPRRAMTLTELEASHIRAVLASAEWRVRGSGGAAERLGLKPTTLESRMARLGIERTNPGGPARVEW